MRISDIEISELFDRLGLIIAVSQAGIEGNIAVRNGQTESAGMKQPPQRNMSNEIVWNGLINHQAKKNLSAGFLRELPPLSGM